MFVRRSRLDQAERELAREQQTTKSLTGALARAQNDARRERNEVRRLTDIIVQMRAQGMTPAPESLEEEVWGSYNVEEAEALRSEQKHRQSISGYDPAVDAMDRELIEAIEAD